MEKHTDNESDCLLMSRDIITIEDEKTPRRRLKDEKIREMISLVEQLILQHITAQKKGRNRAYDYLKKDPRYIENTLPRKGKLKRDVEESLDNLLSQDDLANLEQEFTLFEKKSSLIDAVQHQKVSPSK
ncbi:hypothetical protein EIN_152880 [Entamoeba invadens IP1]|uniref:Uncharacterized protein n=1 Tax=Entamoeba invadens IP1 TaxID=370355 RepID=A0A0A1UEN3_ENTIV|nr:hypothetical protein EIN_152880 [Entamoeba invadens IP1]ELP91291.1 hypothetical protein EIN_152880 [Entamoeba invadens IP1]|eukprot:XP_004258062.1 hypothetical protein EIN_152880 [Entamoeba invadens IP1]